MKGVELNGITYTHIERTTWAAGIVGAPTAVAPRSGAEVSVPFTPDRIQVSRHLDNNGETVATVEITGPRLRKDGTPSARRTGVAWSTGRLHNEWRSMPAWVGALVQDLKKWSEVSK